MEPETDGDTLTQTAENDGNDGKARLDIDGIEVDRKALVAFYHATGGETWRDNTNWLTDKPIGTWYGVETDTTGRVDWLDLSGNQLSGEIPPELGKLVNVVELELTGNYAWGDTGTVETGAQS